ncbi:hypothetical protein ASR47_100299 [Janthinobacterium psychrotolerans]|uniref:Uncharacterized protein n=1 Tax=Janthinobacterium psychrotolerans TaxID=1747903 RepID=A0A1A7BY54_9BURK|nr:hypothetical protein ASR47_100299 [Janthinobacterium psychrotolerans]
MMARRTFLLSMLLPGHALVAGAPFAVHWFLASR